jgi:hypothetical protein
MSAAGRVSSQDPIFDRALIARAQPATNFAREFRSFSSDFNADAIFIANA